MQSKETLTGAEYCLEISSSWGRQCILVYKNITLAPNTLESTTQTAHNCLQVPQPSQASLSARTFTSTPQHKERITITSDILRSKNPLYYCKCSVRREIHSVQLLQNDGTGYVTASRSPEQWTFLRKNSKLIYVFDKF